jgi:phage protein U
MADTATVMMGLGDFRFSISTIAYQELRRKNAWRWPEVERLGTAPVRQFIGKGSETISMTGSIYPSFKPQRAGLTQLPKLRETADKGEAMTLVDGNGVIWGQFCILEIEESQQAFFADGTPRRVDFTIELGASGEEAAANATSGQSDGGPTILEDGSTTNAGNGDIGGG